MTPRPPRHGAADAAVATGRSVPEWRSDNPDAMPPPRVRLRIFEREGGVCHWSGRKIMPGDLWDLDHKLPVEDGGANCETNLFPILRDKHREKTAAENTQRAIERRKRAKHVGTWPKSKRPLRSRGFAASRPSTQEPDA